jgi:dihydrofolate synthase/folylpolyglutamate synthase
VAPAPGRFEIRAGTPPVVFGAAHNPHGAEALARNLAEVAPGRTFAVLAVMADKDDRAALPADAEPHQANPPSAPAHDG